jgi:hypothetical protein
MKQILLYIALAAATATATTLCYKNVQHRAVIAEKNRTIAAHEATIERLAQQEAIKIEIKNEFKSNAVLGKVVVDANIRNVAEQCAAILKGELNGIEKPLK